MLESGEKASLMNQIITISKRTPVEISSQAKSKLSRGVVSLSVQCCPETGSAGLHGNNGPQRNQVISVLSGSGTFAVREYVKGTKVSEKNA